MGRRKSLKCFPVHSAMKSVLSWTTPGLLLWKLNFQHTTPKSHKPCTFNQREEGRKEEERRSKYFRFPILYIYIIYESMYKHSTLIFILLHLLYLTPFTRHKLLFSDYITVGHVPPLSLNNSFTLSRRASFSLSKSKILFCIPLIACMIKSESLIGSSEGNVECSLTYTYRYI
jgi:hypothetical protein